MRAVAACFVLCCLMTAQAWAKDGEILSRAELTASVNAKVAYEQLMFESDGLHIQAFLAYPSAAKDSGEQFPCLLYNRGGNRQLGEFTAKSFQATAAPLAAWGYVVLGVNYRGSGESDGDDEFGGADVADVVNALAIFDQLDFADAQRIGMWGHSRGAMMTYLALMQTDRIDAAICTSGFTNMFSLIERREEMETLVLSQVVPNWESNSEQAMEDRSAVARVHELPSDVPILLMHGTADQRGSPLDTLEMAGELISADIPCRLILFEGTDHALTESRAEAYAQAKSWLDRHVRE